MVGILITGHGHFATGLGSSLQLITGITENVALVDFEAFKFAIDNLYCGKPIHEKSGVDFEESYKLIEDFINSTERITTKDLCEKYTQAFKNRFVDNHFHFRLPMDKDNPVRLPTRRNYLPYFADIIVEKTGDEYYVISSRCENVNVGDVIEDNGCMFETLPQNKNKVSYTLFFNISKRIEYAS